MWIEYVAKRLNEDEDPIESSSMQKQAEAVNYYEKVQTVSVSVIYQKNAAPYLTCHS
jgi:hypothetical protein